MILSNDYKKCARCGEIKHISEYYKGQCYCKSCNYNYQVEYKAKNRESINAYHRQYYADHKENYFNSTKKYMSKFDGYYLYFICKDNEVIYVGATTNIKNRVDCCHLSGNSKLELTNNDWTDVYYVNLPGLNNREELYLYESVFISELKELGMCELNKSNGYYHIDDEVKEILLLEEAYHLLDNLPHYIELYCSNDKLD